MLHRAIPDTEVIAAVRAEAADAQAKDGHTKVNRDMTESNDRGRLKQHKSYHGELLSKHIGTHRTQEKLLLLC